MMISDDTRPVHPALNRNDRLYAARFAREIFEDPDRFMEAWDLAMSVDDNEDAGKLLNNLRVRPDYFGPTRRSPRRVGFSAMRFQRDLARSMMTLREIVIEARRQVDRYNLKALSQSKASGQDGDIGHIGKAIAAALADILGQIVSDADISPITDKVVAAVNTAAGVADTGAVRKGAPDATALTKLAADMRKTANAAANDATFTNIAFRLAELKPIMPEQETAETQSSSKTDEAEDVIEPGFTWKAGGTARSGPQSEASVTNSSIETNNQGSEEHVR